jgi:hypothetical protein
MRFRKIETQKGNAAQSSALSREQAEKGKVELAEQKEHPCREKPRGSLPLEWKELAPFIEAHRTVRPTEHYLDGFWRRFFPRLNLAIRKDELVREYLRETFWPRWMLRAAAVLVVGVLAFGWVAAREENQRLQSRLSQLERDIQVMKAGM